jgi:hypothetical protein
MQGWTNCHFHPSHKQLVYLIDCMMTSGTWPTFDLHYHCNSKCISGFKKSNCHIVRHSLWVYEINHKNKHVVPKFGHPQVRKVNCCNTWIQSWHYKCSMVLAINEGMTMWHVRPFASHLETRPRDSNAWPNISTTCFP